MVSLVKLPFVSIVALGPIATKVNQEVPKPWPGPPKRQLKAGSETLVVHAALLKASELLQPNEVAVAHWSKLGGGAGGTIVTVPVPVLLAPKAPRRIR